MFPLVKNGEANYYQIGIVSYGIGKNLKKNLFLELTSHVFYN